MLTAQRPGRWTAEPCAAADGRSAGALRRPGIRNERPRRGGSAAIPRPASTARKPPRWRGSSRRMTADRSSSGLGAVGTRGLTALRAAPRSPQPTRNSAWVVSPSRSSPARGQRRAEGGRVDVGGDVPLADVAVRRVRGRRRRRGRGSVISVPARRRPVQVGGRGAVVEDEHEARRQPPADLARPRRRPPGGSPARWPSPSAIAGAGQLARRSATAASESSAEHVLEGPVAADPHVDLARPARRGSRRGGPGARRGTRWRGRRRRPARRRARPGRRAGRPAAAARSRSSASAVPVELDGRVARARRASGEPSSRRPAEDRQRQRAGAGAVLAGA